MASRFRNVPVKMIRIQWSDRQQTITHKENVTVAMPRDAETNTTYLRIVVNQKTIISEELNHFQWLYESSSTGVATISAPSMTIVILYNSQDRASCEFFAEMEDFLKPEPERQRPSSPIQRPSPSIQRPSPSIRRPSPSIQRRIEPTQDHIELAVNDLIKFINQGSFTDAERATEYLAKSQAKIQFSLYNPNDDINNRTTTNKIEAAASPNVLRLTLRVECHLNREPLIKTIYVPVGTNLRTLKEEIEKKTGIERKSQYWYAFDRFLINDDYQFGSQDPVVPLRPKNAPRKEAPTPTDPIRSGDTLIMYIAQISTYK